MGSEKASLTAVEIWTLAQYLNSVSAPLDDIPAKTRWLCDWLTKQDSYQGRIFELIEHVGKDAAEKIARVSPDARRPIPLRERNWKVVTMDEVLLSKPVEWLIERKIPAGGLTVIYGQSGAFKSFLALDFAMNLAQKHTVMYVAAEGESGYRARCEAWFKQFQQPTKNLYFVMGQVDMFSRTEFQDFAQVIQGYQPKMIVIDTLAMCYGGANENDPRDMNVIINACKQLSRSLDCAIVMVHHTNKEGRREAGSYKLRGAADTMIRVSRGDDVIIVESTKTKDTSPFEPYYLKEVVIDLGYTNSLGEPVSSLVLLPSKKVLRRDGLTDQQLKVLEFLAIEPNAKIAAIATATEIDNSGVVSKIVSRLIKMGFLQISNGIRNLTDQGRKCITDSKTDSIDSMIPSNSHVTESESVENSGITGIMESSPSDSKSVMESFTKVESSWNQLYSEQPPLLEIPERIKNQYTDGL